MKTSISFVLVTYKPDKSAFLHLIKTLEGYDFIVINNDEPTDLSYPVSLLKGIYVNSAKNIGYGGGANMGIQRALERNAEWIVVLNQDIQISSDSLRQLTGTLQKMKPGIAGPEVGDLDPLRWTTILSPINTDSYQYVTGSCMAIHKRVIQKIGLFYEPYFMYYEDVDMCIRAKQANFPLSRIPLRNYKHNSKKSDSADTAFKHYYLARNHFLFIERCAPLRVKLRELIRLPKTIREHIGRKESTALTGIKHYFMRSFGPTSLI